MQLIDNQSVSYFDDAKFRASSWNRLTLLPRFRRNVAALETFQQPRGDEIFITMSRSTLVNWRVG